MQECSAKYVQLGSNKDLNGLKDECNLFHRCKQHLPAEDTRRSQFRICEKLPLNNEH